VFHAHIVASCALDSFTFKSPRKLAAIFVEAQRRGDVITAPTVALATQVREKLEMQEKSLGMQGLSSPAITTTTRNRQK